MSDTQILTLTDDNFIAKGSHKSCFRHPAFPTRCIKVPYNGAGKVDLNREIFYLTHILKKRGPQSGILPRYYGKVQTDLGEGHVFDLVCDYDGKVSQSIEKLLAQNTLPDAQLTQLKDALLQLRDRMLAYRVISMSIYPENILYQKLNEHDFRLMFINDMGSGSSLAFEYFLPFMAQAKIKRYWNRFVASWQKKLPKELQMLTQDLAFPQ